MDENDPARIFGQTIESDAVKRKRESVLIAELDLQFAEQEGALKRRKIESIQYCLEAIESVGGCDDRDRLRAADMVRSIAWSSSSSSTDTPPADKEICVREVVNAAGRAKESPGIDCKVGRVAKQLYLADFPTYQFPKKQIYCNGQLVEANLWLSSQKKYIEAALASII